MWVGAYIGLTAAAVHMTQAVSATSADTALFVTDYLPDRYREAQEASLVDLSAFGWKGTNKMHSGFFTLQKESGKNTFFWYSEALDGNSSAPVLLWLQGGPGASSLFGMFTEIGPFAIAPGGVVEPRKTNWNEHYHLLFLDNPVGTGFSFTTSEEGFVASHEQAGSDLQIALSQFFELFPALRSNDFYVTGESYAGKWVPSCGFTIHERNRFLPAAKRINLKGIAIGDGALYPGKQFQGFGDLLWYIGMVDESERDMFRQYEKNMQALLNQGNMVAAFEVFDEMLNGDFFPYPTYYANVTGMSTNYFNFELSPDATPLGGDFVSWLNTAEVRSKIHVGSHSYAPYNKSVEEHLKHDWMRDVVAMLVPLMENYKVIIYNGQNDVVLGPALTEQLLKELEWSGKTAYGKAPKIVWQRSTPGPGSKLPDVAGYVRQVGKFSQVVVRGAGHMVPGDQPERALDMLDRFVSGVGFGAIAQNEPHPQSESLVV
jgi:vitellogenic carboxypeptidase-like protein